MKKQDRAVKKQDNVHKYHRQRMKKQFLETGLDGYLDHRVLELLLFFGIPYKDTNEIAHDLINTYGSLSNVFDADYEKLIKHKNMTENAAILLKMIPQLSRLYNLDKMKNGDHFERKTQLEEYIIHNYEGVNVETVYMYILDGEGNMTYKVKLHEGSFNMSTVSPRKIAETAFNKRASSIILSHNHPDGNHNISRDDIIMTKRLKYLFDEFDIPLVEHYLVVKNKIYPIMDYIFGENVLLRQ